uniref:Uncharacterized protein n=1 Tax=Panagrolaimus sp. ES5 TaxID=591445 RepID=A0AC34FFL6_9BILA
MIAIDFKDELKQKLADVAIEFQTRLAKQVEEEKNKLDCSKYETFERNTQKIAPMAAIGFGMSLFGFVQGVKNTLQDKPDIVRRE